MRLPLKQGRFFDDRADSEQVVIVNEALVDRYFPGEDPIGRHVRPFDGSETESPWLRIVGIVGNEKRTAVATEMNWTDTPVLDRIMAPGHTTLCRAPFQSAASGSAGDRPHPAGER